MNTFAHSRPVATDSFDLWLGKPAPRYTSYPPAPFLHSRIGAEDYATTLKSLPPDESLSLYIHIPFCQALCLYCGCNTAVTQRTSRVGDYIDKLIIEAELITHFTGRREISHLHFGGGTPNIMTISDMDRLFNHLRQAFDMDSACEIAMEIDPRYADADLIQAMASHGVTRVSLGVQDFDPDVQAAINRIQPYEQVATVTEALRLSGITNINFDLMYGLPLQTSQSVTKTAIQACGLRPSRIALFSYAHVPHMKRHQQKLESYGLPDAQAKLAMEQASRKIIVGQDYIPIGMDHFATPEDSLSQALQRKTMRRNFQGYTDDMARTLIGLGASAISQTPHGIFQNERDERHYKDHCANRRLATSRGYLTTIEDQLRGAIIEQLMCYLSCDLTKICKTFNKTPDMFDQTLTRLSSFIDAGLVQLDQYKLSVHSDYPMAIRVISMAFDSHSCHDKQPATQAA